LTDILGDEDHLGDMDFKVAGTSRGITALQMDIKIEGINEQIMETALEQALQARLHILGQMNEVMDIARVVTSENAPSLVKLKVDADKIRDIIGKGGATIRAITEESGATVDIDDNGTLELIFTGYDELIHAWDPILNFEISGWPISMGDKSISEPLIADLDNDNDLEVIITTLNGMVNIYHHDGSEYDNFPYNAADSIISTSSIGDLDNDGDYELIFGTTNNLEVIDILDPMGNRYSWKMYRANERRDGFFNSSLASLDYEKNKLPNDFSISNNYPNPFNPLTTFSYNLPKNAKVKIVIYDINGRVVKTLIEDNQLAGYQTISWNSTNQIGETVATGLYFYSIETDNFSKTKKMLLLK